MKKHITHGRKAVLLLVNILLIVAAVLFVFGYSRKVQASQEALLRENFCNTVETMKQISERYLTGEQESAEAWAAYISGKRMTLEEALAYVRAISDTNECEAHFVDMDTFEAWSTKETDGSNRIAFYEICAASDAAERQEIITRLRKMFAGETCVLGKYNLTESRRVVIATGSKVALREENGGQRNYLLLRVVPIERMRERWLFPVSYSRAEIGLISLRGDYVIPSASMRSENFVEFVRAYNFPENFSGADEQLAQLTTQLSGLMELKDSRGRLCCWYYSRLESFADVDILGYIPAEDLEVGDDNLSVVAVVAGALLLMALIDGTYILSINRRLRIAAKEAEQANDAKTQFLSSMSHDIRTPLNAVLGMTELAQSHLENTDYVRECLRKISLSGNHLLTLINDILEISRVESGKIGLNPAPFEVRELVSSLESITRSQAVGHGLTLDVTTDALPEPWLLGDKLRLTQILLNLLNNAVKYTNPGGHIRLAVREELRPEGVDLVCVVGDTGIGMSQAFQATMYDSFTRVADSRIDKIQGTGLGLAIVKRMVDLMGGTVTCVSAEGAGTTFTVRVPLQVAGPVRLQTEQGAPTELGLRGVSVLIAEDNDINWEIISEMLSAYGIRCTRAENGRVCVDTLVEAPAGTYDLVLMDIQMPVLNGRDATRALRASSRADLRRIPVIAMTADAFAEDVQQCMDAGMDAHVAKPIEIEKVLAAIRLLLSRRDSADDRQCE